PCVALTDPYQRVAEVHLHLRPCERRPLVYRFVQRQPVDCHRFLETLCSSLAFAKCPKRQTKSVLNPYPIKRNNRTIRDSGQSPIAINGQCCSSVIPALMPLLVKRVRFLLQIFATFVLTGRWNVTGGSCIKLSGINVSKPRHR